jgi:hypothetical protein
MRLEQWDKTSHFPAAFMNNYATQSGPDGALLRIRAAPGAKKTQIAGPHADAMRVRIHAPANDGKANRELLRFLAKVLRISQSRLEIIRGQSSRDKTVAVKGLDPSEVISRLEDSFNR